MWIRFSSLSSPFFLLFWTAVISASIDGSLLELVWRSVKVIPRIKRIPLSKSTKDRQRLNFWRYQILLQPGQSISILLRVNDYCYPCKNPKFLGHVLPSNACHQYPQRSKPKFSNKANFQSSLLPQILF